MDTQKEREAFEAIAENIRLLRGAKFKDGEYVALSLFDESSKELAAQLSYGWSMWLSAKAQAVPEGFVLVPKEIPDSVIERLRYSSYHWGDGTRDYFTPIYQMMIEAQEPTND